MTVLQPDLDSKTFKWYVRALHIHRRIIMSHNLVTEIKKMLTRSKIREQLAFTIIRRQKLLFALLFFRRPRSRHLLFVGIRYLYGNLLEAICRGKSLLFQLASLSATLTNRALQLAHHWVWSIETAASLNLTSYEYFLVEKCLRAFAIFWGQCQDSL
jgi:hypothetical protein